LLNAAAVDGYQRVSWLQGPASVRSSAPVDASDDHLVLVAACDRQNKANLKIDIRYIYIYVREDKVIIGSIYYLHL
jgi:hypothetical protein